MNLYEYLNKYGTHTTSTLLRNLAKDVHGTSVNMELVEEMAKGLEEALTMFQVSNKPAEF
jgi:hypothetical protein